MFIFLSVEIGIDEERGGSVAGLAFYTKSVFRSTVLILRTCIDTTTYWFQIVLTVAIAIERYILIVRGTEAATILNKRRVALQNMEILTVAGSEARRRGLKNLFRNSLPCQKRLTKNVNQTVPFLWTNFKTTRTEKLDLEWILMAEKKSFFP